MEMIALTPADEWWNTTREYAKNCSWRAGQSLAEAMDRQAFTDWEGVVIDRQMSPWGSEEKIYRQTL